MVQLQHVETEIYIRGDNMKVESQTQPQAISIHDTQAWLRRNIEPVERDGMDGGTWHGFVYDEIVVDGYTEAFVNKWRDDIWAHTENYNVIMHNGHPVKRLGKAHAQRQELDRLWEMDAVIDQLVVDSLEGLV